MKNKLDTSIPANNWKIIELYNKLKKDELDPSPSFQRKLVWKKQHKYKFIETILLNFPFPEIYLAPGELDTESLTLKDLIVDGQQRCTTIRNYIEGKDVFALPSSSITLFSQLSKEEKEDFLNYEVSIRYMKNATKEQITDIFQRINSTEYSLNTTERANARWGDSEFVLFGKQILEEKDKINYEIISYKLDDKNRVLLNNFFIKEFSIFTENDVKRMLALQYILTLIATIIEGTYFRRNDKTQNYIESYNDEFVNASEIEFGLIETISYIVSLKLDDKSYWYNKANLFSIIVELYKYDDLSIIDKSIFSGKLSDFEKDYRKFTSEKDFKENIEGQIKYYEYAKEAVNEISAREHRGNIINDFIKASIIANDKSSLVENQDVINFSLQSTFS